MEVVPNTSLWDRVLAELSYIDKRLAEPTCTPKTTIVLMIMKKRLELIMRDAATGKHHLTFAEVEKEAEKLE